MGRNQRGNFFFFFEKKGEGDMLSVSDHIIWTPDSHPLFLIGSHSCSPLFPKIESLKLRFPVSLAARSSHVIEVPPIRHKHSKLIWKLGRRDIPLQAHVVADAVEESDNSDSSAERFRDNRARANHLTHGVALIPEPASFALSPFLWSSLPTIFSFTFLRKQTKEDAVLCS